MTKKTGADKDLMQGVTSSTVERVYCSAKARTTGKPCRNPPINGSNVCRMHGGAAKQVRAKATERLMSMVMPALAELNKILLRQGTSDVDRLRAIREVLSRTGFSESQIVGLTTAEDVWDSILGGMVTDWKEMPAGQRAELDKVMSSLDRPTAQQIEDGVGGGGEFPDHVTDDLDTNNNTAMRNANRDRADRASRLLEDDEDIVRGTVVSSTDDIDSGYSPVRNRLANLDEPSDFDPAPTRKNGKAPGAARTIRQRVAEGVAETEPGDRYRKGR